MTTTTSTTPKPTTTSTTPKTTATSTTPVTTITSTTPKPTTTSTTPKTTATSTTPVTTTTSTTPKPTTTSTTPKTTAPSTTPVTTTTSTTPKPTTTSTTPKTTATSTTPMTKITSTTPKPTTTSTTLKTTATSTTSKPTTTSTTPKPTTTSTTPKTTATSTTLKPTTTSTTPMTTTTPTTPKHTTTSTTPKTTATSTTPMTTTALTTPKPTTTSTTPKTTTTSTTPKTTTTSTTPKTTATSKTPKPTTTSTTPKTTATSTTLKPTTTSTTPMTTTTPTTPKHTTTSTTPKTTATSTTPMTTTALTTPKPTTTSTTPKTTTTSTTPKTTTTSTTPKTTATSTTPVTTTTSTTPKPTTTSTTPKTTATSTTPMTKITSTTPKPTTTSTTLKTTATSTTSKPTTTSTTPKPTTTSTTPKTTTTSTTPMTTTTSTTPKPTTTSTTPKTTATSTTPMTTITSTTRKTTTTSTTPKPTTTSTTPMTTTTSTTPKPTTTSTTPKTTATSTTPMTTVTLCENNCANAGTCTITPSGPKCDCKHQFTGKHCEHSLCCGDPHHCFNPCVHGNCSEFIDGTVACDCYPGWTGSICNTTWCDQLPPPCGCGSTCLNANESCTCRPGYTGQNCCVDINECKHSPCLHNGTCNNTIGSYHCLCPMDTSGTHCEHKLECKNTSCGVNADCFVNNHAVQCVCKPGFAGNPKAKQGCTQELHNFCGSGDPHYVTYDGRHYDYQGTCPYTWTKVCNETNLPNKLPYFEVVAKNKRYKSERVSYVENTTLHLYGYEVSIGRDQKVTVNGLAVTMPHYIPQKDNYQISISPYGDGGSTVMTDFGLQLMYWSWWRLCVLVPYVPGYTGNLCGLGGNMNNNPLDDLMLPNGTVLMPGGGVSTTAETLFGDSWVTINNTSDCLLGRDMQQTNCTPEVHQEARRKCQLITNNTGPFTQCHKLSTTSQLQSDCEFDMCQFKNSEDVYCNSLSNYATNCQAELLGTSLQWRTKDLCPMSCGPHKHYEACSSSCPSTCSNQTSAQSCNQPCYGGCACDYGYVLSGTECVLMEDCGCNDEQGNYYPVHTTWISSNCTVISTCSGGFIARDPMSCIANSTCALIDQKWDCYCGPGFEGRGSSNCTDINECSVNGTMDCGNGTCMNTLGSFFCKCDPNWFGDRCNVYEDNCKGVVCQHGGTCVSIHSGHECECPAGYYGDKCQWSPKRNCADLWKYHEMTYDDTYKIRLPDGTPFDVYCDMSTDGGGWTVVSRRVDGSQEFYRNWTEYEWGFGERRGEFWMGNRYIHVLTQEETMELRVDLWWCNGDYRFETYRAFRVGDASTNYTLRLGASSGLGTAQNGLAYDDGSGLGLDQNGAQFSTMDRDNDNYPESCADVYHGGFWYNDCCAANLNGRYYTCGAWVGERDGMFWLPYHYDNRPAIHVEMKFRPANF